MLPELLSPGSQVNASEYDLLGIPGQRRLNIENDVGYRAAAPFPACNGRDAKCAMVVTTILYFDESPSPTMQPRQRLTRNGFKLKRFLTKTQHFRNQVVFMIVGNNMQNVWQSLRLLRLEGCP